MHQLSLHSTFCLCSSQQIFRFSKLSSTIRTIPTLKSLCRFCIDCCNCCGTYYSRIAKHPKIKILCAMGCRCPDEYVLYLYCHHTTLQLFCSLFLRWYFGKVSMDRTSDF